MTKKSTATKTTATKSAATKSTRKSSAARTKLPAATPVIIEAVAPPAEAVETVTPVVEASPVETIAAVETVAAVETEAQTAAPEIIEAMAPPTRNLTREEFTATVRREAYFRAVARGFRNGTAFEDWVRAEADVRAQLTAEGATFPAD